MEVIHYLDSFGSLEKNTWTHYPKYNYWTEQDFSNLSVIMSLNYLVLFIKLIITEQN